MLTQILLLASLALGAFAQSSSAVAAQTNLNLFIDAGTDQNFIGSVMAADCGATTYALACTEGDYGSGILSSTCDPSATVRATYGPSYFGISTEAETAGIRATLVQTCSLDGTTLAVCSASIGASADGMSTSGTTTITRSGTDVHYFQVPITAGANKLPGSASCTSTASTGAAAAATGIVDVYKVLVVPAAALLAGAGAFA
ncbi:hypothetical protein LTR37_002947 [Vermiconidia calcicola]|uniref:Uncharacterized protein n=1 Tax=Vermiconidia calcicola TaxID=1690605 RepID=A0ACC3NRT4_9PEZI|nr:hypothetical protein LTR37_002947 [Vermiconidia calcicola]